MVKPVTRLFIPVLHRMVKGFNFPNMSLSDITLLQQGLALRAVILVIGLF